MKNENRDKWNWRKMEQIKEKKRNDEKEEKLWKEYVEKNKRIQKAKEKKEALLEKLKREGKLELRGKNDGWIERKKEIWRKYRETIMEEVDDDEKDEKLRNTIMEAIPERKMKVGSNDEK